MSAPAKDEAVLMLLDSYGLVYRAFFALPVLTTTKGMPINAAYGFTQMLTKLIADEKPTHA
jgi:DNA polymerase-1